MLQEKRRKRGKGDETGEDTVELPARGVVKWKEEICFNFFFNADGLECSVPPTESHVRKRCSSKEKRQKKVVIFLSRNISHLFEASLVLTNDLSDL